MPEGQRQRTPLLIARVEDQGERDFLEGVALAGGTAHVQLDAPPRSRAPHDLHVLTPDEGPPLVLRAQLVGPPSKKGFPLRLAWPGAKGETGTVRRTIAYGSSPPAPPPPSSRFHSAPTLAQKPEPKSEAASAPPAAPAKPGTPVPPSLAARLKGRRLAGGKLVIEAYVGEGGAGTVFRARHRDLKMDVAVKVMHESYQQDAAFCARFQHEALSATRFDHPNLTRVLDFGQEPDGLLYIAMEFLDGQSLRELIEEQKRLPLERALRLMIQVCSGLTHAHARRVFHRDIKPENLVLVKGLDEDGHEIELVKVCDFGVAHGAGSGTRALFAGTPEYMSPEQCQGEEPDAQTDIYACGVVLYELVTGVVPITGESVTQILTRQQTVEPEPPSRHLPGLDAHVDRVVLKALAKEREIRHMSARELRDELKQLVEDLAMYASAYEVRPDIARPASGPRSPVPTTTASPSVSSPAPEEDWIERGPAHLWSMMPTSQAPATSSSSRSIPVLSSIPPAPGHPSAGPPSERSDVARVIAPFLRQLAETTDPAKFASIVAPLEAQVLKLVEDGHMATVWRVRSTLDLIAEEKPQAAQPSRAAHAMKLVAIFTRPNLLVKIALRALEGVEDREGMAAKLVVRAGGDGAYALYRARLQRGIFEARGRFVAILEDLGPAAVPMIREALERIESRLTIAGAVELAEDLLKAVPRRADEALAQLLARYARSSYPNLARVATAALPATWGQRSRALLMWLVQHQDDGVAIAALQGLRGIGGIDLNCVQKLEPLVLGAEGTRTPVRHAAAAALADSSPSALPAARAVLEKALKGAEGVTQDVEDLVVVLSRALLAAGGDAGVVAERWKKSSGSLRARLETLLRS
jgi:eukaryotic-like serine/threonine-protein kinase